MTNVKLKKNPDKTYKLLRQFPSGIKITELAEKRRVERSTIYDHLNSLELRGLAYYERGTAYPQKPESSKEEKADSTHRSSFFDWLDRRAERKRKKEMETRAEVHRDVKWLAKYFPTMEPLKNLFDIEREKLEKN